MLLCVGVKVAKVCDESVQEVFTLAVCFSWMDAMCDPPPRLRTSQASLAAGLESETRLAPVSHVAVSPGFNTSPPQKPRAAARWERLITHDFALRQQVVRTCSGFKYPVVCCRAAPPAANAKHRAGHLSCATRSVAAVSVVVPLHRMSYLIDFL